MNFRLKSDVEFASFDEEAVLFNPSSNLFFKANRVGTLVIAELQSGWQTTEILTERVAMRFEVGSENVGDDVRHYLDTLMKMGVLETRESSGNPPPESQ